MKRLRRWIVRWLMPEIDAQMFKTYSRSNAGTPPSGKP